MHVDHVLASYRTAEQFEAAAESAGVQLTLERYDGPHANYFDEAGPGWMVGLSRGDYVLDEDDLAEAVLVNVQKMRSGLQRLEKWLSRRTS